MQQFWKIAKVKSPRAPKYETTVFIYSILPREKYINEIHSLSISEESIDDSGTERIHLQFLNIEKILMTHEDLIGVPIFVLSQWSESTIKSENSFSRH